MTNLWLAVLSTVLTLAILGVLWLVHRRLTKTLGEIAQVVCIQAIQTENSLRSHIVDEVNGLEEHTAGLALNTLGQLHRTETVLRDFVKDHFSDLRKHAEDLRNHAKELSDRAEVSAASPRQAVTRN